METKTDVKQTAASVKEIGEFFGKMYAYNNSLKLYHWHVTGKGSYAEHMALDQALDDLADALDRIVETSYALYGDIKVVIPETPVPANIVEHSEKFFKYVDYQRDLFKENFTAAILDDYQEAIQQLLYRLKRLS
ncbi:DUF5856 family protein [Bacteroides sp. 51]|uniref:DUF5856 family protein n=1 Tax=Bacteroides sp. 51 TaxID=2302938 RepID=UPI0013D41B76|nr:DUF5856 family protein [Bacteroides sp. 51]NDV82646.1 hypothetical protein [Bacteroides sp. 51]